MDNTENENLLIVPYLHQKMLYEKYTITRYNYWKGLRVPNIKDNGHNWSVYFCLRRKTNNKCPLDGIIYLINEYLNWIPAGCWRNPDIYPDICPVCWCGHWGGDIDKIPITFCSYECLEKDLRMELIKEQEKILNVFMLFNNNYTLDGLEEMEILLENSDNIILNNWFPYELCEDEYDDYDDMYY